MGPRSSAAIFWATFTCMVIVSVTLSCTAPQPIAACPSLRHYDAAHLTAIGAEIPVDGPATKQELKDYAGLRAQVRIACPNSTTTPE